VILFCRPTENLGSFDQGIVLFKSVDPLLKLAKLSKIRAPKIVVYKVGIHLLSAFVA